MNRLHFPATDYNERRKQRAHTLARKRARADKRAHPVAPTPATRKD